MDASFLDQLCLSDELWTKLEVPEVKGGPVVHTEMLNTTCDDDMSLLSVYCCVASVGSILKEPWFYICCCVFVIDTATACWHRMNVTCMNSVL